MTTPTHETTTFDITVSMVIDTKATNADIKAKAANMILDSKIDYLLTGAVAHVYNSVSVRKVSQ